VARHPGPPRRCGMEVPEVTCPALPARDQPAPASGPPGAPGGQASPHLTLGPIILPPEQGLAPTLFLKALPIPLYHTVPPGGLQPRAPLVSGSVDGGSVPFILSPLLQPEGPGSTQVGQPAAPALTVNFVGALPILSPGLGPVLGSPGKVRNAGKYLCPHCGRDCLKPSVLEKHIRSHTGERPFPCATCGIAFKTQSNLYKHRRTQSHLNNSRLSSESDGGGSSLPEEGDKAGVPSGAHGARSERPLSPGAQAAGHCLLPTAHLSPVAKNLDLKLDAVACLGSTFDVREAPVDSAPGLPLASSQPRRKLPEQRSPTASRPGSALQPQQDGRRPPGPEDTATGARPAPCASPPAREGLLVTEPPRQRETVARAGGRDQPRVNRAASRPALSCRGPLCLGSKSPLLPPNGKLELGCQLLPAPSPPKGGDLEAPRRGLPDPKLEGGTRGQAPGGADSFGEDPSWSRPCDRRKGVQGEEKGGLDTGTPAAGVPRGTASFPPTPTCDSWRSGTHDTQQVCSSSTRARARPSGGVLHPWESTGEMGGPPEGAPRGPPSGPLAGLSAGCSRQPGSVLSAVPPPGWPELALCAPAEPPGSCRAQGPFPSLRAEPRLTWCCLSRSLPLPMEQKEKNASVHLAPHFPGGSLRREGPDAQAVSKAVSGGRTRISPGEGGQTHTLKVTPGFVPGPWGLREDAWQAGLVAMERKYEAILPGRIPEGSTQQCADHLAMQHFDARFPQTGILSAEREPFCVVPTMRALSDPTAPGMPSQDWMSEPERKRGWPRRRAKMPRGSSKQKQLSVRSKR
ncbi:hypothetical protein E2I00_012431, partial [Balaenoptera physalus]